MKKLKPILGISLIVQSISFLVLCLINLEKKKSLAAVFGIFSAVGGVAGTALLVSSRNDNKMEEDFFGDEDFFFGEDFDDDFAECDDIECNFVTDEADVAESEA